VVALPLLLAALGLSEVTRAVSAKWMSGSEWALAGLAASGLIAGLVAAGVGGLGLMRIAAMGREAMTSRETMLRSFTTGQKLLPWLIVGNGFFFLIGLVACTGFEILSRAGSGRDSRLEVGLPLMGALFALGLLVTAFRLVWKNYRATRRAFKPGPVDVLGFCISRNDAPMLWAFADEVAGKARVAMADHIVAGLDECFFVTENPVRLRSGKQLPPGRTMYLPMPYMAFMERDEAAAVLGHELAHFSGADTSYSLDFAPIRARMLGCMKALQEANEGWWGGWDWFTRPMGLLAEFFLDTFLLAERHWRRERELVADRVGASVAGARALALSLLRIGMIAPEVEAVLTLPSGREASGGILRKVIARVGERGLGDPRAHLDDSQPHPTDTHPPTRERLATLHVAEDEALFAEAGRRGCSRLLVDLGLAQAGELDGAPELTAIG